jgi:Arc/MetJ-type ribon-helix-helix transcriptional regulator
MTTPVPTRFSDDELELIDRLVEEGIGDNRSAVIRRAVSHLADAVNRRRIGETIAQSYRERPQTPEDDEMAMTSAMALTEAETW